MRVSVLVFVLSVFLSSCANTGSFENANHNPKAADLNIKLGLSYLQQEKYDLANTKLSRALKQAPQSGQANWAYALLQEQLGKPEEARKHYEIALDRTPESSEIKNSYGAFLCKHGSVDRAFELFNSAAMNRLYATPESALTNAGICAMRQNDHTRAENYLRQALDRNNQYASALFQMATLTFRDGRYLASRGYRQRLESVLINDDPKVLGLCVRTEQRLNNSVEAARCARKLKLEFPSSQEAKGIY